MNAFDYFFRYSRNLNKKLVLNSNDAYTFAEIYKQSIKFANFLKDRVGSQKNILIVSQNSQFFIIAYLGIIKSGNIAIPLNPEIEKSNLEFVQEMCNPELIVVSTELTSKFQFHGSTVVDERVMENGIVDGYSPRWMATEDTKEDSLAEIIFTSGSVGRPKGVMISHKNLISNTRSILKYLALTSNDIMLVVLPFYYCYGLSLLHTHLHVGGSIVLNNKFIMLGEVIHDLTYYRCTGFAGVPAHFQILLRKADSFRSSEFPSLKYVTQAGGKLHDTFILEFIHLFPDVKFYVMYGQTEATARLSFLQPDKLPEKVGSCGKGIPDVQLRIIDETGQDVMPGETGEIIASGENIMQGYYKDIDGTEQVLKNGWLYTGDLATLDKDGFIYLLARKKEILKAGGKRISPKEIEEVIVTIPEVIDCIISGIYDEMLGESIKATIVLKKASKEKITQDYIKKYCAQKLAFYKVPQIIEFQDQVTISATGKKIKGTNASQKE